MNNTFEPKRFGLLFKKLLFERSLHLCGSFILVALFTWFLYNATSGGLELGVIMPSVEAFGIGLSLGGIYWVSAGFSYFSNNTEGYGYLMLPASHFEKWLCNILLLGLFLVCYCIFFRILDASYMAHFRNNLNPASHPNDYQKMYDSAYVLSFWNEKRVDLQLTYFTFFNITGAMAVGALYFNKMALVKTMFISIGVFLGLNLLNGQFADAIFQLDMHSYPLWQSVKVYGTYDFIERPEHIDTIYTIGFNYLLPLVLWLIALIRLREKEL